MGRCYRCGEVSWWCAGMKWTGFLSVQTGVPTGTGCMACIMNNGKFSHEGYVGDWQWLQDTAGHRPFNMSFTVILLLVHSLCMSQVMIQCPLERVPQGQITCIYQSPHLFPHSRHTSRPSLSLRTKGVSLRFFPSRLQGTKHSEHRSWVTGKIFSFHKCRENCL